MQAQFGHLCCSKQPVLGQEEEGDLSPWDFVLLFPGELLLVGREMLHWVCSRAQKVCVALARQNGSDGEQDESVMDFLEPYSERACLTGFALD